ncbi:putative transcription factor MYB/SANT family [Arabidopsis thaliana]
MAENSWTTEENEMFKDALVMFTAFLLTRFESVAEYVDRSVDDVKEHYKELVNDLLEMGSSRVAFPNELTKDMAQSSYQAERTIWTKETHEWFLIGLDRFGKDWRKIAVLLDCKTPIQVEIYAENFYQWQSSKKNVINDLNVASTDVNVMKRQGANNTNVDSTGQQESLVALEIGHHAKAPNSK